MSTATATKQATSSNTNLDKVETSNKSEAKMDTPKASYDELLKKFNDFTITDDEEKQLNALRKAKKEEVQVRRTSIQQAIDLIKKHGITLTEIESVVTVSEQDVIDMITDKQIRLETLVDKDIYTGEEIVGIYEGRFAPKKGTKAKAVSTGDKQTRTPKDYGINLVSIKVPNTKGKATTLSVDTPFPAESVKFGASFQYLKDMKDGNPRANFEKFVIDTPEAKEFLASKEGDAWVQKWVGWISRGGKKAK